MTNCRQALAAGLWLILGLGLAGNVFATNGYFMHGMGTKNKARAGSGIALPEEAVATVNNPASAIWVGDRMEVGLALFRPRAFKLFQFGK
jgi:long-chain fatty acid transport protein